MRRLHPDEGSPGAILISPAVEPSHVTDDQVALGVELLANLEHAALSVAEALDRVELITGDPHLQREILRAAEQEGVLEREDDVVRITTHTYVSYDSQVIAREGDFECRRCGAGISTGHFVELDAGELGPFGSSCIRKVTGRE